MRFTPNPFFGSLLLIIGTSIGGGILALPIVVSGLNLYCIFALLAVIWFVMTLNALYLVELTTHFPHKANLITMVKATLGRSATFCTWLFYLCLLYTLIASYLMAGSDLAGGLLHRFSIESPAWLNTIAFLTFFLAIFYHGTRYVDWANRLFMLVKFSSFFILLLCLIPSASLSTVNVSENTINPITAIMPIALSFGFALIVPSLNNYLKSYKKLRLVTFIGSLLPLIIYCLWIIDIHANLSHEELSTLAKSSQVISGFAAVVATKFQVKGAAYALHLFLSIAITTSFLGVSLSFLDFLTDGLKLKEKKPAEKHIPVPTLVLGFLPPLLVVLFKPDIFIDTLKFAGSLCVVLLVLLPTFMISSACYFKGIIKKKPFYCHPVLLVLNIVTGFLLLYLASKDFLS
jgi:tyrosine-specific transport protein